MDRAKFFSSVRAGLLGPTLSTDEVTGCERILDAMLGAPLAWTAYALATAYHETAHTMQPLKERGGDAYFSRRYDPQGNRPDIARSLGNTDPGDGVRFCGRGYVQLTGRRNYARAAAELKLDLIGNPDLAMAPTVAARVMRAGMEEGWFTGRTLGRYLPTQRPADHGAFVLARRIINGLDRAEEIADYAVQFQRALQAGGY